MEAKQMTEEERDQKLDAIVERWKGYKKEHPFELDGIDIEFSSGEVCFTKDYKCILGEDKTLPDIISYCRYESFDDVVAAIVSIRKSIQHYLMEAARAL